MDAIMSRNDEFKHDTTQALEDRALKFIQSLSPQATKANTEKINETDILFNGAFVDFQFSTNLGKYKDLRFDLVSAGHQRGSTLEATKKLLQADKTRFKNLKHFIDNFIDVKKYGKLLDTGNLSRPYSLLYFIYEQPEKEYEDIKTECPDFIYAVKTNTILDYINKNWQSLVAKDMLKFNKTNQATNWNSLFICIPFKDLEEANIGYGIDAKSFYSIFQDPRKK